VSGVLPNASVFRLNDQRARGISNITGNSTQPSDNHSPGNVSPNDPLSNLKIDYKAIKKPMFSSDPSRSYRTIKCENTNNIKIEEESPLTFNSSFEYQPAPMVEDGSTDMHTSHLNSSEGFNIDA
jgi:hypothetical protein